MSNKYGSYYGGGYGGYYGGGYSYGGGNSYGNSYWNDVYSRYASTFSTAEEKREFKKKVIEESRRRYFPTNITVNNSRTEFFKKRRMEININTNDMGKMKGKENTIVDAFQKFPYNSDIGDSEAFRWYLTKDSGDLARYCDTSSGLNIPDMITGYFEGRVTYSDYRKIFKDIKAMKSNSKAESDGKWSGGGEVGSKNNLHRGLYEKNLRIIQSKIRPRSITSQEESLRKGKRINRNFINGTSYKPLMDKTVETAKRKKIMFIIDCSGSMDYARKEGTPAHKGLSFVAAAVNSGVFDCEHVIMHSSGGWENTIRDIRKNNLYSYSGGGEGFEHIDDNLEKDWLRGCDYVVAITDLCIDTASQQGLYDYLKKGKKHLVMSFQNAGKLKGMNVRKIDTPANMINALVTMVGT